MKYQIAYRINYYSTNGYNLMLKSIVSIANILILSQCGSNGQIDSKQCKMGLMFESVVASLGVLLVLICVCIYIKGNRRQTKVDFRAFSGEITKDENQYNTEKEMNPNAAKMKDESQNISNIEQMRRRRRRNRRQNSTSIENKQNVPSFLSMEFK